MNCQTCGNELAAQLSYCNRCGARTAAGMELSARPPAKVTVSIVALSGSMTVVTLAGIIAVIGSAMTLLERDLRMPDGFVFLLFFILVVVLGVDILLARQISRLLGSRNGLAEAWPRQQAPALSNRPAPQLTEMKVPLMSVTENTTRFFDPAFEKIDSQSKS